MAGEDAELVGGISVSIGGSHAALAAALAEAEKMVETSVQRMERAASVSIGGQVRGVEGGGRREAAPRQSSYTFGGGGAAGQEHTAFQRAVNAALAKNGEVINEYTGEVEKAAETTRRRRTATAPSEAPMAPVEVDTSSLQTVIAELQAAVAEVSAALKAVAAAAESAGSGGGGGGGRGGSRGGGGRGRSRVADEGEGGDEAEMRPFDIRQPIREVGAVNPLGVQRPIRTARSEQERAVLAAQKQAEGELAAQLKHNNEETIQELSRQAQADQAGFLASATLAPQRTQPRPQPRPTPGPATPSNASPPPPPPAGPPPAGPPPAGPPPAGPPPPPPAGGGNPYTFFPGGGGGGGAIPPDEFSWQQLQRREIQREREAARANLRREQQRAEIARRSEQQLSLVEAGQQASARTPRTGASGLGGYFLGPKREEIEARQDLIRLERDLGSATRLRAVYSRQITDLEAEATVIGGVRGDQLREEADLIRKGPDYAKAKKEEVVALNKVSDATERVNKLSSGFGTAARGLAAVTIGGAAFGLGLGAITAALSLSQKALGTQIDRMTGYASISTRVTSALAQQTLAQHGNVEAVIAQQAAQAGLSKSYTDIIGKQLALTTQVKAGALAQMQASELTQAASGVRGGAPQGLFEGFGGLFGSSFLASEMGGGKGFTEQLLQDARALTRDKNQPSLTDTLGSGSLGVSAGMPGDILGGVGDFLFGAPKADLAGPTPEIVGFLDDLNAAAKRGADALGQTVAGTYAFTTSQEEMKQAIADAADESSREMAKLGIVMRGLGDDARKAGEQLSTQAAVGRTRQDPAQTAAITKAADEAMIRAAERTQQIALQRQLPAQAGLQNLAQPLLPPGTGIAAANADEQALITKGIERSAELQTELNTYYQQGQDILRDTYNIPQSTLSSISALGNEIAGIQASISNQQAAFQTKQYNFQLFIAKRSLSDIGGLINQNLGAGKSQLGVLEGQNLALSRQSQQLGFQLSQRQINFKTALAGFQAPGVTPEERQARVKEAQIEASFAQKQLDIQRKMFGNQVKIVDIQNLRQGADLVKQIGLLTEGRRITIDIAVKQEQLILAQKRSEMLVKEAGTFLTKVDTLTASAISRVQEMETAALRALTRVEVKSVKLVSDFIGDLADAWFNSITFPAINQSGGVGNVPYGPSTEKKNASGAIFQTNGATRVTSNDIAGEAGSETVAILRNVRPYSPGGGVNIGSIFSGPISVRDNNDIEEIARKVQKVIGTTAALKGLRSIN